MCLAIGRLLLEILVILVRDLDGSGEACILLVESLPDLIPRSLSVSKTCLGRISRAQAGACYWGSRGDALSLASRVELASGAGCASASTVDAAWVLVGRAVAAGLLNLPAGRIRAKR